MGSITFIADLAPSEQKHPLFLFKVPAGFPSPAQDHMENVISLDELMGLRAPHIYLVRSAGDSLVGVGIYDGDVLVVDRSLEPSSGMVVIAALNGEPLVKIFTRRGEEVVLESANDRYAPRYILESDELQIWGVVSYSVRSHGRT